MRTIYITVRNKIATALNAETIICGNADYTAVFDFDEEWENEAIKTARFSTGHGYVDVILTGNKCAIPVLYHTYYCKVGVYAGDLRTTTPAYIDCVKSILCDDGPPADPPPDVYNQLIEKIESGMLQGPPGHTPTKGTDYYTEEDKQALTAEILEKVKQGIPAYKGDYTVTPATHAQTLETKDKLLEKDFTVEKIPFFEVSNNAGGKTVTIGGT